MCHVSLQSDSLKFMFKHVSLMNYYDVTTHINVICLFSQMAEGNGNRRQPHNLQGVLRMAVEAGSASDGPAPTEPMTQEVRNYPANSKLHHEISIKHLQLYYSHR